MEGARIEFHLRNENNEIAMMGDRIERNPIVKDDYPLQGVLTGITLNDPVHGTAAGIILDGEHNIPLQQVGDFKLVYSESSYLPKRPSSLSSLFARATGDKQPQCDVEERL